MEDVAQLLHEVLRQLRRERNWTVQDLHSRTAQIGEPIPFKSLEAMESPRRSGQMPKAATLRTLARAFGVEPARFYEWPIALAQEERKAAVTALTEELEGAAQRREQRGADNGSDPRGRRQGGRAR